MWRRIEEKGEIVKKVERKKDEVRNEFENLIKMEERGWKGSRGKEMDVESFSEDLEREEVKNIEEWECVRIKKMEIDGRVIEIIIVLMV